MPRWHTTARWHRIGGRRCRKRIRARSGRKPSCSRTSRCCIHRCCCMMSVHTRCLLSCTRGRCCLKGIHARPACIAAQGPSRPRSCRCCMSCRCRTPCSDTICPQGCIACRCWSLCTRAGQGCIASSASLRSSTLRRSTGCCRTWWRRTIGRWHRRSDRMCSIRIRGRQACRLSRCPGTRRWSSPAAAGSRPSRPTIHRSCIPGNWCCPRIACRRDCSPLRMKAGLKGEQKREGLLFYAPMEHLGQVFAGKR